MSALKIGKKVSSVYRTLGSKVVTPAAKLGSKAGNLLVGKLIEAGTSALAAKAIGALI